MSTPESLDTTAPVVEKKSRWEDYIDVFFSPTELFERRRDDKLAPALITLLVLAAILYYVMLPANAMLKDAVLTPEMQAQMAKMGGFSKAMSLIGGIFVPVFYIIMLSVTAGILWLLARLVDADPNFHDMMIVATYGGFIYLLGSTIGLLTVLLHGATGLDPVRHTSLGILRFVDYKTMPKALVPFLSRIDIFKIWQAIVWAIGFHVVTGASKAKSGIVAGSAWILFALPGVLGAGAASKMGQVQMKTGA